MLTPRRAAAAVALGGRLYVVGGAGGVTVQDPSVATADCLDLQRDHWECLPPMPSARRGLALLAADRILYAIGGSDGTGASCAVEMFNPAAGCWEIGASMPVRRAFWRCCSADARSPRLDHRACGSARIEVHIFTPGTRSHA